MTHAKKLLSLLLVLALVLSLAPMAFAAEGDETEAEAQTVETTEEAAEAEAPVEEEAAEPVEIAEEAEDEAEPVEADLDAAPLVGDVAMSGSCGDNLTWELTLTGEGTEIVTEDETEVEKNYKYYSVTISGTGAMADYDNDSNMCPWRAAMGPLNDEEDPDYGHRVTNVSLPCGLTYIGANAFRALRLTSLDLSVCPNLTTIGEHAFYGCSFLTSLDLSVCPNLTTIGEHAFGNCYGVEWIRFPASLTSIGSQAFWNPTSLHSVDFTKVDFENLTLPTNAFWGNAEKRRLAVFYTPTEVALSSLRASMVHVAVVPADASFTSFTADRLATPAINSATQVFGGWYTAAGGTGTAYGGGKLAGNRTWYAYTPVGQVKSDLERYLDSAFTGVSSAKTVSLANESYSGSTTVSGVLTLLNTSEYLITVDLAGKTVTADGLVVFGQVAIIDSVGGGKLVVPQNRIYLTAGNGSSTGTGYLPIWDNGNSAYRFYSTDLSDEAYGGNNKSLARYFVRLTYGDDNMATLMTNNNTSVTGVNVLFRMTWTTDMGDVSQEFVFNNTQTKAGATSGDDHMSSYFVLNIKGADGLTTSESDKNLKVTPILRFSGSCITEIQGTEYTLSLA